MQLGEAVLMAKHGDNFDKFKKSMTGADGDLTRFYTLAKNEGINFNQTGVDGTQVKKDFKDKSVIEAEYLAEISKIEAETKAALEEAAGDSKTVSAILKLKDRLIGNLKPDSSKVDTIDSVNTTMSTEDGFPKTEKQKLKEVQTNIQTEETTKTETQEEPSKIAGLQSEDVPLFIPKDWKIEYEKQKIDANNVDYSSKEYSKKISDTVLTLIPNAETKNYFELDKDNKITSAKTPIINADVTIQSLINNSLDDVTMNETFSVTGKDKTKINLGVNERFQLAKNHVEDYGMWMADGKVLGDSGSLKNLFKKESTALVVPANSIININNNKLKGYENVFNTIDKE
jgi:hypothetical protein